MTGKELIIYILENDLLDTPVFENGKFLDYLTVDEAALIFEVGSETIKVWYEIGMMPGIKIADKIYIKNYKKGGT